MRRLPWIALLGALWIGLCIGGAAAEPIRLAQAPVETACTDSPKDQVCGTAEGWGGLTIVANPPEPKTRRAPRDEEHERDPWAGLAELFDEMTRQGGFGHMDGK